MEEIFLKNIAEMGGLGLIVGFLIWKILEFSKIQTKNQIEQSNKVLDNQLLNTQKQTEVIAELNKNVQSSGLLIYKELQSITKDIKELATKDSITNNHKEVMEFLKSMENRLENIIKNAR